MYSRYNFLKRQMMKRIAAQAGRDTDTARDYGYTDWKDLDRSTRGFAATILR
jgi:menaquinone-dependent protoporphyrinogen oxidase